MKSFAILLVACSALLLTPAGAQGVVQADVSQDQYGALCAGAYVLQVAPGYVVVCAGKGIIDTSHPLDCPVYVDVSYLGPGLCL